MKDNVEQVQKSIGSSFDQNLARIAVGGYDDAQDVRKAMMNRVRDVIRKKNEGISFDEVEDEKEDKNFDSKYSDDELSGLIDEMKDEGKLTGREYEYLEKMLEAGSTAEQLENEFHDVMDITSAEPVYRNWLSNVYGVSSTLTARFLHRFGYCEDFERVSDLWSYCGLTPSSSRDKGEQLSYDPQAKKLAWLVADCMMKGGDNSAYRREFFDPYKEKQLDRMDKAEDMTEAQLEEKTWTPPKSQGHAHNRSMRYLAKKFLKHYWAISRDIKGLDVPDEYIIAHGGHEKREDTWENPFYAKKQLQ